MERIQEEKHSNLGKVINIFIPS